LHIRQASLGHFYSTTPQSAYTFLYIFIQSARKHLHPKSFSWSMRMCSVCVCDAILPVGMQKGEKKVNTSPGPNAVD
jgi:hypothetical protein